MDISKRQYSILDYIYENPYVQRTDIEAYLLSLGEVATKVTVLRDLDALIAKRLVKTKGKARNTSYVAANMSYLMRKYDVEEYFNKRYDEREVKYVQFNFDIFKKFKNIFLNSEMKELEKATVQFNSKISQLTPGILKKEYERLMIELSWKSSQIEGNTYTLLDTEVLIKDNTEAEGHKREEAVMILNHKAALDFVFNNKDYFETLSVSKIEMLHSILVDNLSVEKGLRKSPVGIVGTDYRPLSNQHQIREAVEKLVTLVNSVKNPVEKALITVLMISYIQPFEDGNKRCGRILANAVLMAHGACPISYRSVDEKEYKKAVIIFYETNSLVYFKKLFIEQYRFAVQKYF